MPNHVHAVVRPLPGHELADILHSWKSFTAKKINGVLGQEGQLWQEEYYDHLVRDEEELAAIISYVVSNPHRAGLRDWPWSGVREGNGQDGHWTHGQDARATREVEGVRIEHVTVATTRPETMLGDTAVAMNPSDPRADVLIGKLVRLPIVGREIPIIADPHVVLPDPESEDEKARFSTGFLKVTPAHDPDDYAIGQRHELPIVNVMAPDGTISDRHGWDDADAPEAQNLIGMDRFEAREAVVEWFRTENLLEDVREYVHQVGHSYRSHVPIEPYLSDQWYIAVKKPIPDLGSRISDCGLRERGLIEERNGVAHIKDTDVPVLSLAGLALAPLLDGRVRFMPERYAKTYQAWLENLRDWPISRQLWWGHRIPIWSLDLETNVPHGPEHEGRGPRPEEVAALDKAIGGPFSEMFRAHNVHYVLRVEPHPENDNWIRTYICVDRDEPGAVEMIEKAGWGRDPDVLDTWFSSALWPFSTLGWPEETPELKTFYPGHLLCTAREIITLWVSRMVMMGQYCIGDIPFPDVFIHAMIQDGEGRKMSKSLGNGIDPLDIIDSHGSDAMRFTLISMTTQTQDVRMPVEHVTLPDGRAVNSSPKFDVGRNFCNKLWNAARFALMNLADGAPTVDTAALAFEDRWILSRCNTTVEAVTSAFAAYRFNDAASAIYDFTWHDFCDWYVEIIKPRLAGGSGTGVSPVDGHGRDGRATGGQARAVLAHVFDTILRLLHPVMPFITEELWQSLGSAVAVRGLGAGAETPASIMVAPWPEAQAGLSAPALESDMEIAQEVIRAVRNIRSKLGVNARQPVELLISTSDEGAASSIDTNRAFIQHLANASALTVGPEVVKPAQAAAEVTGFAEVFVPLAGLIDTGAEKERLEKRQAELRGKLEGVEKKLANESFTSKAPAEIVEKERAKAADIRSQLDAVDRNLKDVTAV